MKSKDNQLIYIHSNQNNILIDKLVTSIINKKLINNSEVSLKCFQELSKEGHTVAITSFPKYPDSIKPALEKLELNNKDLEKFCIIAGFPAELDDPHRKKEHIEAVMTHYGITDFSKVALIDDDKKNVNIAKKFGVVGIQGSNPNSEDYLNDVKAFANGALKPNSKDKDLKYFDAILEVAHSTSTFTGAQSKGAQTHSRTSGIPDRSPGFQR